MKKLILILTFSFFSSFLFGNPYTDNSSSVDIPLDFSGDWYVEDEVFYDGYGSAYSVITYEFLFYYDTTSSYDSSSTADSSSALQIDSSSLISIDWGGLSSNIITFLFNVLIVFICIGLGIWAVRKLLTLFRRFSK